MVFNGAISMRIVYWEKIRIRMLRLGSYSTQEKMKY